MIRFKHHMTYFEVATHKLRNPASNKDKAEKCFKHELQIYAVILSRVSAVEGATSLSQSEEFSRPLGIVQSGTNKRLFSTQITTHTTQTHCEKMDILDSEMLGLLTDHLCRGLQTRVLLA